MPRELPERGTQLFGKERSDAKRAGCGDQDRERHVRCDRQQILFQKDGAEHDEEIAAQVGELFGDGRRGVARQERDGRGRGGRRRRQFKYRLLLFRKGVDGRLMVRGVGRSLPYREDGKERRQNEKRRERGLLSCH